MQRRRKMGKWTLLIVVVVAAFSFFQLAEAKMVYISFNPPASGSVPTGYKVYVGTTYASVANKQVTPVDIGNRHSYCLNLVDNIVGFFLTVSAYNSTGEGPLFQPIAWVLYGNIVGDWNDGISYAAARVDGQDQTAIGQYFGQTVAQQQFICNEEFVVQVPSLKQKADLNRDGRVDGKDLSILGQKWGKTLPP